MFVSAGKDLLWRGFCSIRLVTRTNKRNNIDEEATMNRQNYFRWAMLAVGATTCVVLGLALSTGLREWNPVRANERTKAADDKRALDADLISKAAGVKATTAPDGVVRIAWSRTDVTVKVDGMVLKPFAGLGSWAAFTSAPHGAMVMGDTVVFEDEVGPAMDAAFAGGLEVTGLHNHFFHDEPKVYFMHIGGSGDPDKLAVAVKGVWDAIKKVRSAHQQPATHFAGEAPKAGTIDAAAIEKAIGHKSETQQGVVKVTIAREGTMHKVKVGGSMGLSTWAAFSGDDKLATVDGDFIMTAQEVQPVLRALRKGGIEVVALHNHMIGEEPAFYFAHFWGKGAASDLSDAIKNALDAQKKAGKGH
jgi:hypothetical protein